MPTYSYIAKNLKGQTKKGTIRGEWQYNGSVSALGRWPEFDSRHPDIKLVQIFDLATSFSAPPKL